MPPTDRSSIPLKSEADELKDPTDQIPLEITSKAQSNKAEQRLKAVVQAVSFTSFIAAERVTERTSSLPKQSEPSTDNLPPLPSPSGTARSLVASFGENIQSNV